VFDAAGRVALAIMVLGPSFDLTPAEIETLGERLRVTARDATTRIGGRAPEPVARVAGVAS
jgi:DNA-binding IclR family transcriptional regulator